MCNSFLAISSRRAISVSKSIEGRISVAERAGACASKYACSRFIDDVWRSDIRIARTSAIAYNVKLSIQYLCRNQLTF